MDLSSDKFKNILKSEAIRKVWVNSVISWKSSILERIIENEMVNMF